MHILVTNDDGVTAPGLLALAEGMQQFGRVSVLAPDHDWSGGGHVKTRNRPLRVRRLQLANGMPAMTSDGSPADCVALALMGLVRENVDLVVSGINPTANLGHNVTYSGTVTAVMEAASRGVAGVAVSMDNHAQSATNIDYGAAVGVAVRVVHEIIHQGLPKGTFLNVNVPYFAESRLRGIQLTRQGLEIGRQQLASQGNDYYRIHGDQSVGLPEMGTDVGALARGYASVTPLHLDLTARAALPTLQDWSWKGPATVENSSAAVYLAT